MKLTTENTRVDYTDSQFANITILEGDNSGIVFRYGKVWINTDDIENPSLQFEYDLISGTPVDKELFENEIAHLLHETMMQQLDAGEIQYHGGTSTDDHTIESLIEEAKTGSDFPKQYAEPGTFVAKKEENAMSFLDRLAAEGMSAMSRDKNT